jgi:ribose transport system substrate-binding protein
VDGVILYVNDRDALTPYINRLELDGVPVVTVESDAPSSRRSSFVGTNSARLGQRIGSLLTELKPDGVKPGMIRSINFSDAASQWNIIYYAVLAMLSADNGDEITAIVPSPRGVVSAEDAAREALFLRSDTNVLFTTSVEDTLATIQVVRDFTEPGTVEIVGYGGSLRLQEALEEGTIAALVVRRPEEIARNAVQALIDLNEERYVSSAIYVESDIRTR